ncbi:DUF222 domain-containing protein [Kribbella sp. NPDC000426]|uniref:HNH endonuclease signature motif containing protein n=1 Tax=Kribbella sp. NPDC000426 TaxID=3154255 RepID=UPI0033245F3E
MGTLGERPAWSMSGGEKLTTLDQVDAEQARLETYRLQLVAGLDEDGYAQEIGARDTVQLLEYRYRLDHTRAFRDVRLARALPKYAAVSAALPVVGGAVLGQEAPDFQLRPAQAEAIVSGLEKVPDTVPVEDLDVTERELVRLARHLPPAELRKAARSARDILDTDGPEPEERRAYARESLTMTNADRGVKFRGYLANENAELLRSLIHTGARPHKTLDGDPDPRPREKRQADALTTALTLAATTLDTTPATPSATADSAATGSAAAIPAAADSPATGSAAAIPAAADSAATGSATAIPAAASCAASGTAAATPAATAPAAGSAAVGPAAAALAATDSAAAAGVDGVGVDGAGSSCRGIRPVPGFGAKANLTVTIDWQDLKSATADAIGDTVYGGGLSAATIRRLACDAKIIPLVLGSNSEPLDVGRCERLVTRAMRRALNARDRGCVVCGAPPVMCDAHHLISWIDGGITAVSNLALLCRRHHIDVHNGDWTITITDGKVHVARPTWADPPDTVLVPSGARTHSSTPGVLLRPGPKSPPGREAASLAIWGELPSPAPPDSPSSQAHADDARFAPWDPRGAPTPQTAG